MTRIVLIILWALVAAAPASAKERSFILGGFERIVVEGDIVVHITTGVSPSAAAEGTLDQLDRVRLVRAPVDARQVAPQAQNATKLVHAGFHEVTVARH